MVYPPGWFEQFGTDGALKSDDDEVEAKTQVESKTETVADVVVSSSTAEDSVEPTVEMTSTSATSTPASSSATPVQKSFEGQNRSRTNDPCYPSHLHTVQRSAQSVTSLKRQQNLQLKAQELNEKQRLLQRLLAPQKLKCELVFAYGKRVSKWYKKGKKSSDVAGEAAGVTTTSSIATETVVNSNNNNTRSENVLATAIVNRCTPSPLDQLLIRLAALS